MKIFTSPVSALLLSNAVSVDAGFWDRWNRGNTVAENKRQNDQRRRQFDLQKRKQAQQHARINANLQAVQAKVQPVAAAPNKVQLRNGVVWDEMLGMPMPDDIKQNMIRLNQNYVNANQHNLSADAKAKVQQARQNLIDLQRQRSIAGQLRNQQANASQLNRLQARKAQQQHNNTPVVRGALPVINRKSVRTQFPTTRVNQKPEFHDSVDLVDHKGVSLSSVELRSLIQQTSAFINNNRHLNPNHDTMKQAQQMLKELQERLPAKLQFEQIEADNIYNDMPCALVMPTIPKNFPVARKALPKSFDENSERRTYLQVDSDWQEVQKKIAEWQAILDENTDIDNNHRVKKPMMKLLEEMKQHVTKLRQQQQMLYNLQQNLQKKFHGAPSNDAFKRVWADFDKIKAYFFTNPQAKVTVPFKEKMLSIKDDGNRNIWGRKENIPGILAEFGKRAGKSPRENQLAAALYIGIIARYAQQMHDHVALHPADKSKVWGRIAARMDEFVMLNKNNIPGVKIGNGIQPLPVIYNETGLLKAMTALGIQRAKIPSQYNEHFQPDWSMPKAPGGGGGGGGGGHFKTPERTAIAMAA